MEKSHFVSHLKTILLDHFPANSVVFFLVLAVFSVQYLLSKNKNEKKWPPSPPTLPLLGNLHQFRKGTFHSNLTDMGRSYGPVMTVWMGKSPLVVLSGQTAIWEALVNQASNFAGRPYLPTRRTLTAGQKTISTLDYNERWIKLRKILHNNVLSPSHIASLSSSHQKNVKDLINKLVEKMKANNGVVTPLHFFKIMAINFIAQFCFGADFQDENFACNLERLVAEDISSLGGTLLDRIPFWNPLSVIAEKKRNALRARILELFSPIIRLGRRYRPYFKQSFPNCFLNCLLSIGEGEEENADKVKLSDEEIIFNIFELFVLSVDSTSTTLEWALAYLINNPQIQSWAYQEIDEAFPGRKEQLFWQENLGKLPYLQAVVKETLRKEGIAPLGVPHETANACKVMGIEIPAKAVVMFNLHSASNDSQVWRDPDCFRPERFLGTNIVDLDRVRCWYLPFGAGRRICAGMDIANLYIPITLANLLKIFKWGCVKEGSPPDLERENHSVLMFMKNPLQARITCR